VKALRESTGWAGWAGQGRMKEKAGRRKKDEGSRKKEEGRRKKE